MFFGHSLKHLVESHFFLREQFSLEPQFDRDDTISNASLLLYIIFISEACCFEGKKRGLGLGLGCPPTTTPPPLVYLTFSFFIAASFQIRSLVSKIELKSPGERMLKWRHVITVPYQWLTEACVPQPVTTLSLSLPGPVGSTTPHHHSTVDTSWEKLKVSQEGSSSEIPLKPLTQAQYRKASSTARGARDRGREGCLPWTARITVLCQERLQLTVIKNKRNKEASHIIWARKCKWKQTGRSFTSRGRCSGASCLQYPAKIF